MTLIVPVIMAGGAGTRLWPLSRDSMPKQFIALLEDDKLLVTGKLWPSYFVVKLEGE